MALISYLAALSMGKTVLWCYLIWYLVTVFLHFDASPGLWINSLGISVVIGIGLILSVAKAGSQRPDRWQTLRLFLMPFCVSSFSSLIKEQGYLFIFPTQMQALGFSLAACAVFVGLVVVAKRCCQGAKRGI